MSGTFVYLLTHKSKKKEKKKTCQMTGKSKKSHERFVLFEQKKIPLEKYIPPPSSHILAKLGNKTFEDAQL